MSGEALLKALRAQEDLAGLPILFVTASARQGDIQTLSGYGRRWRHHQTFDPPSLAARCGTIIGASKGTLARQRNRRQPAAGRRRHVDLARIAAMR